MCTHVHKDHWNKSNMHFQVHCTFTKPLSVSFGLTLRPRRRRRCLLIRPARRAARRAARSGQCANTHSHTADRNRNRDRREREKEDQIESEGEKSVCEYFLSRRNANLRRNKRCIVETMSGRRQRDFHCQINAGSGQTDLQMCPSVSRIHIS